MLDVVRMWKRGVVGGGGGGGGEVVKKKKGRVFFPSLSLSLSLTFSTWKKVKTHFWKDTRFCVIQKENGVPQYLFVDVF